VLKKPFKEKSFKDSWIIFSLRLIIGPLKKVRDRPVGLFFSNGSQIYCQVFLREIFTFLLVLWISDNRVLEREIHR